MTQLLLTTITTLANGTRRETQTAVPAATSQPVQVNVSANTKQSFRLVDAKTGQVIKAQQVVKKGKALQVLVDGQEVLTLDNFFATEAGQSEASAATATATATATEGASYVVNIAEVDQIVQSRSARFASADKIGSVESILLCYSAVGACALCQP
jgi:hypothetical protein